MARNGRKLAKKRKPGIVRDAGLTAAIKAAGGNDSKLADRINLSRQAVGKWKRIPAERVIDVEQATGVSRRVLRPDLYAA